MNSTKDTLLANYSLIKLKYFIQTYQNQKKKHEIPKIRFFISGRCQGQLGILKPYNIYFMYRKPFMSCVYTFAWVEKKTLRISTQPTAAWLNKDLYLFSSFSLSLDLCSEGSEKLVRHVTQVEEG